MWHMRPGTRVRFWSPRYNHKPGVEPPVLLRLLSSLSIFSLVGVLIYAVAVTLDGTWTITSGVESAPYIAILHLVLPFCIFYTVSTNSWISRPLIAIYFVVLYVATMLGKGFLGGAVAGSTYKSVLATAVVVIILGWLFRSPAMRIYYLLLAGKPIPDDLQTRAAELASRESPNPKLVAAIEWCVDHLETLVMVALIVAVIYAWATHGL